MSKMLHGLGLIRVAVESVQPAPAAEPLPSFTIITAPHDCYVRSTSGLETSIGPLVLEHMPSETPESVHDSESKNIDRVQEVGPSEEQIIADLQQKAKKLTRSRARPESMLLV